MKVNLARITWISCIFLFLIVVLIMIIDYKVNYQYLINNKLYFYECDEILCVSEVQEKEKLIFSIYECGLGQECPVYQRNIEDNYAILSNKEKTILYDYRKGTIISEDYADYEFINNNYIIVTQNGLKGIINIKNKLIVKTEYEELGDKSNNYLEGYNVRNIIAKKDNKYGIISYKDGSIIEEFNYEEKDIPTLLETIQKEEF